MTRKGNIVWKATVALVLLAAMVLNLCAFTVQETAAAISSFLSSGAHSGEGAGGQTVGEGDPTLSEIEIPTVTSNPYRPTVHPLYYPVMRSDRINYSDSAFYTVSDNGRASGHSSLYSLSLSSLLGYYHAGGYAGSYAKQDRAASRMRKNTLNPDLTVFGRKLGFAVNAPGSADDYTDFIDGSYVYDHLHLNKEHLSFEITAKQVGMNHVKMEVFADHVNGKSYVYRREMTHDGDRGTIRVPLKDLTSLSGNVDGYCYGGSTFTDVMAILVDDTAPSVTDIVISQNIKDNDDAELVMTMTFNEGIRFADLRKDSATRYLDSMWIEVEIEELETGKLRTVRLYTSDVGTDCTMTLRADIGRYHYVKYRVNRVTRVGFEEVVGIGDYTMTAIDLGADADGGHEAALYSYADTGAGVYRASYTGNVTPITDMAGNSLQLDSIVNWEFGDQFNSPSFGIEDIEIYNDKTLSVIEDGLGEDELRPEDLYIGTATNMTVKVYLSRILTEEQWRRVSIKLNLRDHNGDPILLTPTRAMEYSRNYLYDNGTLKGSVLLFENIRFPEGAIPDVEAGGDPLIRVTELIHSIPGFTFYPYFDTPSTDMRTDFTSPTVTARLVDTKTVTEGSDRYHTAVLEMTLSDVADYERIAGLVGGDITVHLGAGVAEEVGFRYLFSTEAVPPSTPAGYTGVGTFSKNGEAKVGYLRIVNDPAKFYLHLLVEQDGIYLRDLFLDVLATDAVGNVNDRSGIPICFSYTLDEVPPEVKILSKTVTAIEDNTKLSLDVRVSADDPSAVERMEYYVGDDPGAEGVSWTAIVKEDDGTAAFGNVIREYGGIGSADNKAISELLWVRAVDRDGNISEPVSTVISLNLEKPATVARLVSDGNRVLTDHRILVSGPPAAADGTSAYTRVTITPLHGNGFAYVAVIGTGESEVDLFDFENTAYYKVKTENTVGGAVYTEVIGPVSYDGTAPEAHLLGELFRYYGELKISFENGYGSMVPRVGDRTYDAANDGSYYKDPNYFTVRFASPYDAGRTVHEVTFGKVVSRTDDLITETLQKDGTPVVIPQSDIGFGAMRNMQIHFSIANIAERSFGYLDLDYVGSFMQLYRLSEDGGEDILMSEVRGLAASGSQYFTVGNTDDNGNLYETGAYYLRVTVLSVSGHTDVYTSGLLILDAQTADSAGVWEYRYFSPSNIHTVNDPTAYAPITVTRDPATESCITDLGISVMAGGETMRSRVFAVYSYGVDSLVISLSAPNTVKTVAGVEVGKVAGFKLWNILSAPTAEELAAAPFSLNEGDSLSIRNRLDDIYDKDTIPKGQGAIGQLHLVKGVNTFCYQAKLENGYVTPIRYFTVTVTDKAPVLNIAIGDYIPSHDPSAVSGVLNVDSIKMFVETAYSFNGSGHVDVQLFSRYAMNLGLYSEGELTEGYYDHDVNGEEVVGVLTVLRSGLTEGEYAVLTENSYTTDFPNHHSLCSAAFVAVDEYGGTTIVAPQIGNARRYDVYGGVPAWQEYDISYDGQYYNDPYTLGDNGISWRVRYHEASYNGNILLGFESTLRYNDGVDEGAVKTLSASDASLGRNLFHISSNDIDPHPTYTEVTGGADTVGTVVWMAKVTNAALISEFSTITLTGDGIAGGEVTLPLFEPNTEYGYSGAELVTYGPERTMGLRFTFANPRADSEHPAGTELKRTFRLSLNNGYGETFSAPAYWGSGNNPYFWGDFSVYYIDYGIADIEMTESGAVLIPGFATPDGSDEGIPTGKFNPNSAEGTDGEYTVTLHDLFGNVLSIPYKIDDALVTDPISRVEISDPNPTAEPVIVTIQQPGGSIYVDIVDHAVMSVEGNGSSYVTVTLTANARFSYRYLTAEGEEKLCFITVANIVKPSPTVTFDPSPLTPATDPITGEQFLYGEVRAYITDPNFAIVDAATGQPTVFTFLPGAPTSYTYPAGTLLARLGSMEGEEIPLGEITVSLPFPLREIPDPFTASEDDVAPALQVLAYSNRAGEWSEERLALRLTARRDLVGLTDYEGYTVFSLSGERANMERLLAQMGWSTSYRFLFEVMDESRVRFFLKEGLYAEAPAFENGISDIIDGVELHSRLLTVTKAAKFTVFAVDANGNTSSVAFDINNVGEAPAPTVRRVPIDGGIRVYLLKPDGAEDLEILTVGMTVGVENTAGEFFGLPYVDIRENDTYEILYQMTYQGNRIAPAILDVSVSELRPQEITLTGGIVWSANKLSEATAKDVVAVMQFSDTVTRIASVTDYDTAAVDFLLSGKELRVTYKKNAAPITFRCYAENGSFVTVELDAVANIDREAPVILCEKTLAADAKSVLLTMKANERVTFREGGGSVGELIDGVYHYTRLITENGEYTYTFTDMSGITVTVTVTVTELVLEPLTVLFSKAADGTGAVDSPEKLSELTVGETVFVKPSRDASLLLSDGRTVAVVSDSFTPIPIPAPLGGISPYVTVTDRYGNVFVGQFASIIPLDTSAPELMIGKDVWTARIGTDRAELRAALIANATAFDDSDGGVTVTVELPESLEAVGVYDVKYVATDAAGNFSELYGRLRLTSIYDPVVHLGDRKIDRDDGVYLKEGEELLLTVNSAGVAFDLYLVAGRKTAAQIKGEAPLADHSLGGEISLGELTSGIYTVLIVTEQRDYFRFLLSVTADEPGT